MLRGPDADLKRPADPRVTTAGGNVDGMVDFLVVGCGAPARSMGWYHARQILDGEVPGARLSHVVEPWFLAGGRDSEPGTAFLTFKAEAEARGTAFHSSVADLQNAEISRNSCAIIASRTADNPQLFHAVIDAGVKYIYLEKPGAPTVAELENMAVYAEANAVQVFMGYNKNVSKYTRQALQAEKKHPEAITTYMHNNTFTTETLPECFERNCEGILKNMAVHELCLLVTYYGLSSSRLEKYEFEDDHTSCQTLGDVTDFDKIGIVLQTASGKVVRVRADRCGGESAWASLEVDGTEKVRFTTPDDELTEAILERQSRHPGYVPYFYVNHDDYVYLKSAVSSHILSGHEGTGPEGVATIDVAIETLKLAEFLTQKALAKYSPKGTTSSL
eukprot:gene6309-7561_t